MRTYIDFDPASDLRVLNLAKIDHTRGKRLNSLLRNVGADAIFFAPYAYKSSDEELWFEVCQAPIEKVGQNMKLPGYIEMRIVTETQPMQFVHQRFDGPPQRVVRGVPGVFFHGCGDRMYISKGNYLLRLSPQLSKELMDDEADIYHSRVKLATVALYELWLWLYAEGGTNDVERYLTYNAAESTVFGQSFFKKELQT